VIIYRNDLKKRLDISCRVRFLNGTTQPKKPKELNKQIKSKHVVLLPVMKDSNLCLVGERNLKGIVHFVPVHCWHTCSSPHDVVLAIELLILWDGYFLQFDMLETWQDRRNSCSSSGILMLCCAATCSTICDLLDHFGIYIGSNYKEI
jgi:hypothetical protein